MKPFFNPRRRTRFAAAVVLFIWLLVLSTGIANACRVAENHARHGHLSHHQEDTALAKAACQNFCSTEQTGAGRLATDLPENPDLTQALPLVAWATPSFADHAARLLALNDPPWLDPLCSCAFCA